MEHSKNIISFFGRIIQDEGLHTSHISMYVSLFQFWSLNHFQNPFRITRGGIMESSKIRSLATYHKCIKELHNAGFIIYTPSYDPYKGTLVQIINPECVESSQKKTVQGSKLLVQKENCIDVPIFYDVELYFNERNLPSAEAIKFYSYYESRNWKLSNENPMKSWHAAARNWISHLKEK